MRKRIQQNEILNPENVFSNLIQDYIRGALDDTRVFFRASVVAVDHVGGQFETSPTNPKNSIKARIFTNNFDAFTSDDDLPIFWPMFSHDILPIKEREHVYIVFEDEKRQHGLWFSRIPQPQTVDSKNFVDGVQQYIDYATNNLSQADADRVVQNLTSAPAQVSVSDEVVIEDDVPFTARIGDRVIAGSNNALIVLGRDRPGNKDTGQHDHAGTIDVVVGRQTAEDMDMQNDKARVYVSANTDPDTNAGTTSIGQSAQASSAVIAIGDQIRIVARAGTKIVVTGGDLTIEGQNINVGNNAQQHAVLGDQLSSWLGDLLTAIEAITVATPAGPSAVPNNVAQFTALQGRLQSLLSQTVKVKQ